MPATKTSFLQENEVNIHFSMCFPLKLARIFGFFPINGISNPDHKSLKFSWFNLKTSYALFHFLALFLIFLTIINRMIYTGTTLGQTSTMIFFGSGILSSLLLIKLATEWPNLLQEWHNVENSMGLVGITTNLKRKIKLLTVSFMLLALLEYVLIQIYVIIVANALECENWEEGFKKFYIHNYDFIFTIIDYALWKGIFIQIIVIKATFSWTYVDVFIILISTALASRIKQIKSKIKLFLLVKVKNPLLWRKIREEYHQLWQLCSLVDNKLSYIVLLSFGTNLYFVLVQLFGNMKEVVTNNFKKVYYSVSFGLLILRLSSVCLIGASINEESKKILPLLFSVPSSLYCAEIEKFIDQVVKTTIVITGKNFFKITRSLILQIAGAIVSYELVLIQFQTPPLVQQEGNLPVYNNTD